MVVVGLNPWSRSIALMSANVSFTSPGCIGCGSMSALWFVARSSKLDDAHQVFASVVADIVDRVRRDASAGLDRSVIGRRAVETGDDAGNDIVDIGEVAPHLAMIEQGQRLAGEQRLGENPHRHVRPAPRPVNREEAQAGARQPVNVGIGLRSSAHSPSCLRRRARADDRPCPRPETGATCCPRRRRRKTRRRNGSSRGCGRAPACCRGRQQVRLEIGAGVLEAVANAGLRAEMDDAVEITTAAESLKRRGVGKIEPRRRRNRSPKSDARRSSRACFNARIVIVVEIVDADDRLAAREQGSGRCRPDESSNPRDEHRHSRRLAGGGAAPLLLFPFRPELDRAASEHVAWRRIAADQKSHSSCWDGSRSRHAWCRAKSPECSGRRPTTAPCG